MKIPVPDTIQRPCFCPACEKEEMEILVSFVTSPTSSDNPLRTRQGVIADAHCSYCDVHFAYRAFPPDTRLDTAADLFYFDLSWRAETIKHELDMQEDDA